VTQGTTIRSAEGKLGVLLVGLGAVSTTTIAGIMAVRKGLAKPIGSLTEMGTVRLGKRTDGRSPAIRDFVPLARYDQLVFGGWDIFQDNCYESAKHAGVLEDKDLDPVKDELKAIKPMSAVFDRQYVKRLDGPNVKKGKNKKDLAEQLIADIRKFKSDNGCDRLVLLWVGSTEIYMTEAPCHKSLAAFEKGLETNDPMISSSLIYAYAAIKEGIPYANAAPNLSAEIPALLELAQKTGSPLCGSDMKTGQTLIKTIIAPGLKARLIGVAGWYSTNILGNRDGEVLDDPGVVQDERGEQERRARLHLSAPPLSGSLQGHFPRRPHQLLPAASRQQGRLGQHRHLRLARLSDAAQDQFPVPRQHPGRADRRGRRPVPRPGAARRHVGDSGVVVLLLQEPDARARPVSRARLVHPVDEAEEHAALPARRGTNYALGP
jgi:myo-inositol-1-phosphate synthase